MKRLLTALRWYFIPGFEITREARGKGRASRTGRVRAVFIHAVPRVLVFAVFVWSIATSNWYAAAVLAVAIVALGFLSWWITRWALKRLGGTDA
jgi:amino acid permease